MSAADRDYWREPEPSGPRLGFQLPPVTRILFFALIACFVVQAVNDVHGSGGLVRHLALTREGVRQGWAWQLLTFQFLHGGLNHLLANLLALWTFGGPVERILGPRRFLLAYLGAGVAGGLLEALLMSAFPRSFGPMVVGASAGLEGLFAIFALLHRDAVFNVFFILPVRAITLYYVLGGLSLFFTLVPSGLGAGIAHGAHLGGLLFGTLWIRLGWHHDYQPLPGQEWWERFRARRRPRAAAPPSRPAASGAASGTRPLARPGVVRPDLSREVDAILDKIARQGMHSLTAAERQTLDDARRQLGGK